MCLERACDIFLFRLAACTLVGVPKIKGTTWGVPIISILVFWGLLGSPDFGKLPVIMMVVPFTLKLGMTIATLIAM